MALVSLVGPVAGLAGGRRAIRRGREAAAAIFEFLDRQGKRPRPRMPSSCRRSLADRVPSVSLKEPGTGRMLLENVSFAIPAGAKVAIVGPDPTEKHALVYLLPRFLDPTSGEIRIDDTTYAG